MGSAKRVRVHLGWALFGWLVACCAAMVFPWVFVSPVLGQANARTDRASQLEQTLRQKMTDGTEVRELVALVDQLIALRRVSDGPKSEAYATALDLAYWLHYRAEDPIRTMATQEELISVYRELDGEKSWRATWMAMRQVELNWMLTKRTREDRRLYSDISTAKSFQEVNSLLMQNWRPGNEKRAMELLERGKRELKRLFDGCPIPGDQGYVYAQYLHLESRIPEVLGRLDQAVLLQEQSVAILTRLTGPIGDKQSVALSRLGMLYLNMQRFDEAEYRLRQALLSYQTTKMADGIDYYRTIGYLADVSKAKSQFGIAKTLVEQQLAFALRPTSPPLEKVNVYARASGIANASGRYEDAVGYGEKALAALATQQIPPQSDMSLLPLSQLGSAYRGLRQYDKAVAQYKKLLDWAVRYKSITWQRTALSFMAWVHVDQRDVDSLGKVIASLEATGVRELLPNDPVRRDYEQLRQELSNVSLAAALKSRDIAKATQLLQAQRDGLRETGQEKGLLANWVRNDLEIMPLVAKLSEADYARWLEARSNVDAAIDNADLSKTWFDKYLAAEKVYTALGLQQDIRVALCQARRGQVLKERGDTYGAIELLSQATTTMDKQWGEYTSPDLQILAWLDLGLSQKSRDNLMGRAIASLRRAVELAERKSASGFYRGNHPIAKKQGLALRALADAERWNGLYDEAETHATMAVDLYTRLNGAVNLEVCAAKVLRADVRMQRGKYVDAATEYQEVLEIHQKVGASESERSVALAGLGMALASQRQYVEAEAKLLAALQLLETHRKADFWTIGRVYTYLGDICSGTNRVDQAIEYHRKAVTLWENTPGFMPVLLNSVREKLMSNFNVRAFALEQKGEFTKANEQRNMAREVAVKMRGEQSTSVRMIDGWIRSNEIGAKLPPAAVAEVVAAIPMLDKLNAQNQQRQYSTTIDQAQKLAELFERHLGPNNVRALLTRQIRMEALLGAGRFADALQESDKVLAMHVAIKGQEDTAMATINMMQGSAHASLGQIPLAIEKFEHAVTLFESLGNYPADFATALLQLGRYRLEEDRVAEAVVPIQRGLDKQRIVARQRPDLYVGALAIAAECSTRLGDLQLAEAYLAEGKQLAETGKLTNNVAYEMILRAETLQLLAAGRTEEAAETSRRWLELAGKFWDSKYPAYRVALRWRGVVLCRNGQFDLAMPIAEQTIQLAKSRPGGEVASLGQALLLLGEAQQGAGNLAAARATTQEAVNEMAKEVRREHERLVAAREQLARLEWSLGNEAAARAARLENLSAVAAHFEELAGVANEDQVLRLAASMRQSLYSVLSLPDESSSADAIYDEVLRWKGAAFVRRLALRDVMRDPKNGPLIQQWQKAASVLATNALRPPYIEGHAIWFQQLSFQRMELARLDSALARLAKPLPPIRSAEIKAALPKNAVLIDMVAYPHTEPDPAQAGSWKSSTRFALFVLRKDQPVVRVDIADGDQVTALVEKWRALLEEAKAAPPGASQEAVLTESLPALQEVGGALRGLVLQPIASYLEDAELLVLSPDAALTALPFGALPGSDPQKFLIEEKALMVVPAARLLAQSQNATASDPSLLVFGQVDYGARPGENVRNVLDKAISGGMTQLIHDHIECGAVLDNFKQNFPNQTPSYVIKADATEANFRQQANQYRWVHISTHGFFLESFSLHGVLDRNLPTLPGMPAPAKIEGSTYGIGTLDHPGLQCGMGLAGANVINRPGEDDGILSALEVSTMDLSHVDGIVLSACQTALGSIRYGEGVLGLQRAFHQAGAHSVVATLWSVPVGETIDLLNAYYQARWTGGYAPAFALQSAQTRFIQSARDASEESLPGHNVHPYFWAGFSLSAGRIESSQE